MSMHKPGSNHRPDKLITCASWGILTEAAGPTALIRLPSINTTASGILCPLFISTTVALTSTIVSVGAFVSAGEAAEASKTMRPITVPCVRLNNFIDACS